MSYGLDTSKPPILVIRFLLNRFAENDVHRAIADPELAPDALAAFEVVVVDLTGGRELSTSQLIFLMILYDRVVTTTGQPPIAVWFGPGELDDQMMAFATISRGGFTHMPSLEQAQRY
ncbi:MAG: hypothetical protein HY341_01495, partial [Candidatus Kerfeldbacteria bacterium]|nr:hypothetical protein [Candidatus Kerfeldbacteria bacterium]